MPERGQVRARGRPWHGPRCLWRPDLALRTAQVWPNGLRQHRL